MRGSMRTKLNKYILLGFAVIMPTIVSADRGLHTLNADASLVNDTQIQEIQGFSLKPYVSLKGGWIKFNNIVNESYYRHKIGYGVRIALGLAYEYFDYEAEGIYTSYNHRDMLVSGPKNAKPTQFKRIKDGKTTSYSAMFNIYFKTMPNEIISPYIGTGIGITKPYFKKYNNKESDIKFKALPSYQLIAGMSLNLLDEINVLFDYRYFSTFKTLKSKGYNGSLSRFKNQSINLGIKFMF